MKRNDFPLNGRFPTTPPAPSQMDRSRGEVLLVSAFATLPSTPPGMVDAVTLSMPVAGNDEAAALWKLALELAGEYDVRADFAVSRGHFIVRVTRLSTTEEDG